MSEAPMSGEEPTRRSTRRPTLGMGLSAILILVSFLAYSPRSMVRESIPGARRYALNGEAVPGQTRGRIQGALAGLEMAQELHFANNFEYASDVDALSEWVDAPPSAVVRVYAEGLEWAGVVSLSDQPGTCAVWKAGDADADIFLDGLNGISRVVVEAARDEPGTRVCDWSLTPESLLGFGWQFRIGAITKRVVLPLCMMLLGLVGAVLSLRAALASRSSRTA